jgi:hypothetical protein
MGMFSGFVRWMGLPYVEAYRSVRRVTKAASGLKEAMARSDEENEGTPVVQDEARPDDPEERFEWYCERMSVTDEQLAWRSFWFEFSRRLSIGVAWLCIPLTVPAIWVAGAMAGTADMAVGMAFAVIALRCAFFNHQLRNRRIVSFRTFLGAPTLFTEWWKWQQ